MTVEQGVELIGQVASAIQRLEQVNSQLLGVQVVGLVILGLLAALIWATSWGR